MDKGPSEPKRVPSRVRVSYVFCTGVACLVVAVLLLPLFYLELQSVKRFWREARTEVVTGLTTTNPSVQQAGDALVRSMGETGAARAQATLNRAMEIEALLLAPGILLIVFSVRERKLHKVIESLKTSGGAAKGQA